MTSSVCNPSVVIEVHESTRIVYYGALIGGRTHPFPNRPSGRPFYSNYFFAVTNLYPGLMEGWSCSIVPCW